MKKTGFLVLLALGLTSVGVGSAWACMDDSNAEETLLESVTALHESEITLADVLSDMGRTLDTLDAALEERGASKQVLQKLTIIRKARARVIRNFASKPPPRAYAGSDPQSAARAQDKAQRYTQFVQLSTQLMNELQSTERELVDILQTLKRDADNLWKAYAAMRDCEFRTAERIMTIR